MLSRGTVFLCVTLIFQKSMSDGSKIPFCGLLVATSPDIFPSVGVIAHCFILFYMAFPVPPLIVCMCYAWLFLLPPAFLLS
ncbi:hypothetical protein QBC36DRAFT_320300 [Triangularia setosa]|uniref:Uncharacterized protein n=1 Tax=Triangularia setosa TaxID=2587417 RepID=A0AAN6WEG2_9PEZI|nr:hypothetical protein QBC36DRAFT_320300 [Podospora setosa]